MHAGTQVYQVWLRVVAKGGRNIKWKLWHGKEWVRDKYSMKGSRVLYVVSKPLFEWHIFHIALV